MTLPLSYSRLRDSCAPRFGGQARVLPPPNTRSTAPIRRSGPASLQHRALDPLPLAALPAFARRNCAPFLAALLRRAKAGGEGRIRTSEGARPTDLQSVAFDRSATSPMLMARFRSTPGIRQPMHHARRRSSLIDYCRYAPLLTPSVGQCAASISAPSALRRISRLHQRDPERQVHSRQMLAETQGWVYRRRTATSSHVHPRRSLYSATFRTPLTNSYSGHSAAALDGARSTTGPRGWWPRSRRPGHSHDTWKRSLSFPWSWRRDSNPRPADYKSAALPN